MDNHIIFISQSHRQLLTLALPLILANITTPLLGLVDTAILGRMEDVSILAGAAIGSLIITQLYWICGFLKMSVTGLSAQSVNKAWPDSLQVIVQGAALALFFAFIILILQSAVVNAGLFFAQASPEITFNVEAYFYTRVWGAPAALLNMVLIGWLIGHQKTTSVLVLQIIVNVTNIVASLIFVFGLDWGVKGVAAATVFAEYLMLISAIYIARNYFLSATPTLNSEDSGQSKLKSGLSRVSFSRLKGWFSISELSELLSLNSHIFIRNLALQFTLAFITLKGAQYGAQAAAVNAIIMQFFALIALGLDGIANAVEALVGEAKGLKNHRKLYQQVRIGLIWSSIIAVIYALIFYFLDSPIINLLTHHAALVDATLKYKVIIVLIPLVAHWCFLFDGVFVGLSLGKPMRNTMVLSTLLGFLPTWWWFANLENMALWLAMLVFLAFRGGLLGGYFLYLKHYHANTLMN